MSDFISRQKKHSFVFLLLGLFTLLISFQNFEYPQQITKSNIDVTAVLNSSDHEIQNTRERLNPNRMQARTQVVETAPLKIKLRRAPAKTTPKKKSPKKKLKKKKKLKAIQPLSN